MMHDHKLTDIAFLFDLDGVIIDSEGSYSLIWEEIEKVYPTGQEDFAATIKGSTLEKILTTWFLKEDREDVERRLYELEAEMVYEPCRGALDFLNLLKERGIPMALVTSSDELKMNHLWEQMPALKKYFDVIITGDMVSRSKPDPEGYLLAAAKLGVAPGNCVVAEDSRQGLEAARAAGAKVVGVAGTLPRNVVESLADITVTNLMELEPLLSHGHK